MGQKKTNIIVIIPARGGSKRLPQKNIRLLNGLPLFVHSILYAKTVVDYDLDICVSTDDLLTKSIALEHNVIVVDRPSIISGDTSTTLSALQHVLKVSNKTYDWIVLLQPTNPLRPKDLLTESLKLFESQNLNSLFTVSPIISKFGRIKKNRFIPLNYSPGDRSQDLKPLYFENGLLYITKANLIEKGNLVTENSFPLVVDHIYGNVDIDTEDDFLYAEFLINKH